MTMGTHRCAFGSYQSSDNKRMRPCLLSCGGDQRVLLAVDAVEAEVVLDAAGEWAEWGECGEGGEREERDEWDERGDGSAEGVGVASRVAMSANAHAPRPARDIRCSRERQ